MGLKGQSLEDYYQSAFKFLTKAMKSIKKYLPWGDDHILMLADAFLLIKGDEERVTIKLNKLGEYFNNVITKLPFSKSSNCI